MSQVVTYSVRQNIDEEHPNRYRVMSSTPLSTSEQRTKSPAALRWLAISRRRAFLTHLLSSAVIVSAVCVLVFFVWYPHPYFRISGAWNPLRVLIGVDLVLGPLLTLLVFKP